MGREVPYKFTAGKPNRIVVWCCQTRAGGTMRGIQIESSKSNPIKQSEKVGVIYLDVDKVECNRCGFNGSINRDILAGEWKEIQPKSTKKNESKPKASTKTKKKSSKKNS